MKIEFTILGDADESKLAIGFCKFLVRNIKKDILESINPEKMQMREEDLIDASWIKWVDIPKRINVYKLCKVIINNIIYKTRVGGRYVIEIDNSVYMKHSETRLEAVARFLDMGNNVTQPTGFINKVFMKYRKNINDYWKAYTSTVLHRVTVNEVVIIR